MKKGLTLLIAAVMVSTLSGCYTLTRETAPDPSTTAPAAEGILLTTTPEVTALPMLGSTEQFPTGWELGVSTQNEDGSIVLGGEVTPQHVLYFTTDKTCQFETIVILKEPNGHPRGDLFETKELIYSLSSALGGEIQNESTYSVKTLEPTDTLELVTITTSTETGQVTYIAARSFSTNVSTEFGDGYPTLQTMLTCEEGASVTVEQWEALLDTLTVRLL